MSRGDIEVVLYRKVTYSYRLLTKNGDVARAYMVDDFNFNIVEYRDDPDNYDNVISDYLDSLALTYDRLTIVSFGDIQKHVNFH